MLNRFLALIKLYQYMYNQLFSMYNCKAIYPGAFYGIHTFPFLYLLLSTTVLNIKMEILGYTIDINKMLKVILRVCLIFQES